MSATSDTPRPSGTGNPSATVYLDMDAGGDAPWNPYEPAESVPADADSQPADGQDLVGGLVAEGRVEVAAAGVGSHTLYRTTDHSVFSSHPRNRPVNLLHVGELKRSIRQNNLLHLHPIIVNPALEVLSGQHRLAAAETLGIAIYFNVSADFTDTDMITTNQMQAKWNYAQVLEYYLAQGLEDYMMLDRFCKMWSVTVVDGIELLSGKSMNQSPRRAFEQGLFRVTNLENANRLMQVMRDFSGYFPAFHRTKVFRTALNRVVSAPGFSKEHMLGKLRATGGRVLPSTRADDYVRQLLEVYNYRSSSEELTLKGLRPK